MNKILNYIKSLTNINKYNTSMIKYPKFYTKEILKNALPKYCKGKTIDVGAGRAKYKSIITQFSSSYISIDNISSEYQFKDNFSQLDIIADVLDMPFDNNQFDTVICTEVLEHVEDPFKLISEISRILKHGGYLMISSGWIAPYHKEPKDYWRFSIDAYKLLCDKNDLEIIEIYKKGGIFSIFLYFLNRNIELNTKKLHKILVKFNRFKIILERIFSKFDGIIKTEDTIGHFIVARKK